MDTKTTEMTRRTLYLSKELNKRVRIFAIEQDVNINSILVSCLELLVDGRLPMFDDIMDKPDNIG